MMSVSWLLALLYFLLFSWIIWRGTWFQIDGISRRTVLAAFYLKLVFGVLFWAVYTFHYSVDHDSDAFSYFEEGKILYGVFHENPVHFFRLLLATNPSDPELQEHILAMDRWNRAVSYGVLNDNPTIIKFNAVVMFFSRGLYHTHTLFMAFVCFSGLLLFYRFFAHFSRGIPKWALFGAVILPPSLLFWGGGVMKEGLLIFGLGCLFYGTVKLSMKRNLSGWLLILGAVFLLLFTKAYVLIAFTPALLFLLLVQYSGSSKLWLKFIGLHVGLFAFVFSTGYWLDDYDVMHMFQLKQKDFYNLGADQQVGSMIQIPPLHKTSDLIIHTPNALFNTYFRPHLLEARSVSFLVSAGENLFYMVLIVFSLIKFSRPSSTNLNLALICFSCVVGLGMLIGLITPVLGAIVRYKIPALPFLVVLCFVLMQPWLAGLKRPEWIQSFKTKK